MIARFGSAAVLLLALAACGSEPAAPKAAAVPDKLPAGQYEATIKITSLKSADGTPVPTFAKEGQTITTTGCVGADGLPEAEMLATRGDSCQIENPYVRGGRMNVTLNCQRKGQGQVMTMLDGDYTAEGFTGTLKATSAFPGQGDFTMAADVTAKKTAAQCTPKAGAAA